MNKGHISLLPSFFLSFFPGNIFDSSESVQKSLSSLRRLLIMKLTLPLSILALAHRGTAAPALESHGVTITIYEADGAVAEAPLHAAKLDQPVHALRNCKAGVLYCGRTLLAIGELLSLPWILCFGSYRRRRLSWGVAGRSGRRIRKREKKANVFGGRRL